MPAKLCHIGDILSVTTGILVSPKGMDGLHPFLEFLAGGPVWTHQLPRVAKEATPWLIEQYPALASPELARAVADLERMIEVASDAAGDQLVEPLILGWLTNESAPILGGLKLRVKPLPRGRHAHVNPVEELRAMCPDAKIIPVVTD